MPDKLLGRRFEERSIGAAGGCTSSDLTILPEELIVIENAHRAFTRVVSEVPVRMHSALRAEVLRGANEETEIRCLSPIMHGHISGQRSHAAQQRARNTRHVHNLQEFPMFKCVLVKRCCPTSKSVRRPSPAPRAPFHSLDVGASRAASALRGFACLTCFSSHASCSASACKMLSLARYQCPSLGKSTRRAVPPSPLMAAKSRSDCIG